MAKKVCEKCGRTIEHDSFPINDVDYCWRCSREIKRETIAKVYPTAESKLIGIIEHIDNLNSKIENQQIHIKSLITNSNIMIALFIVIVILLIVIITTMRQMRVF